MFSEYNVKVEVSRTFTFFTIVMTIFKNREKGE